MPADAEQEVLEGTFLAFAFLILGFGKGSDCFRLSNRIQHAFKGYWFFTLQSK